MNTPPRSGTITSEPRQHRAIATNLDALLSALLELLVDDKSLPDSNHDHALKGEWADYRECHIKPDLLLIYSKPDDDNTLRLARLGSHSELFR